MATVKFSTRGKSDFSNITIRFIDGKETDFRRSTPLIVNPAYFNNKTGRVRRIAEYKDKDKFQQKLDNLRLHVITQYNNVVGQGGIIDSTWLKNEIDTFFNVSKKTDLNYLVNYSQYYIGEMSKRPNPKTGKPFSKSTINNYETILKKIQGFQNHKRRKYRVSDVNLTFRTEFIDYLMNVDKLHKNTVGRYFGTLKKMCKSAKKLNIKISNELDEVNGWKVKKQYIIFLDLKELHKIENTAFGDDKLNRAKDWLIIGCFIGQRVGDLMQLSKNNIVYRLIDGNKTKVIELIQEKGNQDIPVLIPIFPQVEQILKKWNGFPPKFGKLPKSSAAKLNKYIKEVCKIAGVTNMVKGERKNPKTNRLELGIYPKYELVGTHICRRSFCSNFYTKIPTPTLMQITGHKKESQFLDYIGKTSIDYLGGMLNYISQFGNEDKANDNAALRVAR